MNGTWKLNKIDVESGQNRILCQVSGGGGAERRLYVSSENDVGDRRTRGLSLIRWRTRHGKSWAPRDLIQRRFHM